MAKIKQIEKILKDFWIQEREGSTHACTLPTNKEEKDEHPSHRRITVEEAAEKIMKLK